MPTVGAVTAGRALPAGQHHELRRGGQLSHARRIRTESHQGSLNQGCGSGSGCFEPIRIRFSKYVQISIRFLK